MKNNTTKIIVIGLLCLSSLGSYVFLSSQSPSMQQSMAESEHTERTDADYALPEVMMVKHIIDLGKQFTSLGR